MGASIRILAAIAAMCLTIMGLLTVFGVITTETLSFGAGRIMLGVGVLLAAALVFKALGFGQKSNDAEPPPTL